jgi:hypothetical protein
MEAWAGACNETMQPIREAMMQYAAVRGQLKTGDVILFSGKSGISEGIKFFTLSKWSHVGMVYKFNDPLDEKGTVFCWESTTIGNVEDADTGRLTNGVQRVELSERLERCFAQRYEISIRPLNKDLTPDMILQLNNFRHEVSGRPYERNKIELIKSALDGHIFKENKEDLSSLFCSELLAESFQRIGLLPEDVPSNEYTPKDFSQEKGLKLLNGYTLGSEMVLDAL